MDKQEVVELQILQEIENNGQVTQRDLAKRTGITLSYLNSYLKQLIKRELILVQKMDGKRFLYNLTPEGMVEKVRMTTEYAKWSLNNYKYIREKVIQLCHGLEQNNLYRIVICGISEAAEIVYIATLESGLEIIKVVDDQEEKQVWLKQPVEPIASLVNCSNDYDCIIISDISRSQKLAQKLYLLQIPLRKMKVCTGQKIRPATGVELVD